MPWFCQACNLGLDVLVLRHTLERLGLVLVSGNFGRSRSCLVLRHYGLVLQALVFSMSHS